MFLYFGSDNFLKSVSLSTSGGRVAASAARSLFEMPTLLSPFYEPSADGEKFLVNAVVSEAPPITVILNWKAPNGS